MGSEVFFSVVVVQKERNKMCVNTNMRREWTCSDWSVRG